MRNDCLLQRQITPLLFPCLFNEGPKFNCKEMIRDNMNKSDDLALDNLIVFDVVEPVSIECRKTKTKVITLANQKGRRQSSKPIKTESNYT